MKIENIFYLAIRLVTLAGNHSIHQQTDNSAVSFKFNNCGMDSFKLWIIFHIMFNATENPLLISYKNECSALNFTALNVP